MWKAGNVINRIGNNSPAVLIWDSETDSDIGEARTIEAARIMAAGPAMLAALQMALTALECSATERGVRHLEAVAVRDAIALATGAPTSEAEAPPPIVGISAGVTGSDLGAAKSYLQTAFDRDGTSESEDESLRRVISLLDMIERGETEPSAPTMGIGVNGFALIPHSNGDGFTLETFEPGTFEPVSRRYISETKLRAALAALDCDGEG